ncbi:hypothetical protein ACG873_18500 [Mesorhizobium sp. AaZ16]|uniref:hypothetical protein n=1 Tax=Mesorhizobium sp. AaZ16 TaxID=3402289 RepID=UPI00374EEB79
MPMPKWVRLPSDWIEAKGLRQLQWGGGVGSDNTAALMALMVIAHHSDADTGIAKITYDALCKATSLSRAKLSNGLDVLAGLKVIERSPAGRSTYQLSNFDRDRGWAMLPARCLYSASRIAAFKDFKLRSATELNAMKLYFLFAARRGRDTNMANISFDKIEEYAGVERQRIKAATSLLATASFAYIERVPSNTNEYGVANAYRLAGLESNNHMGTRGRGLDAVDSDWSIAAE